MLAAGTLVAACGDDGGSAAPGGEPAGTTDTTAATTTSATEPDDTTTTTVDEGADEEAEVLAAYEQGWTETMAAYDPPDPAHPSVEAHTTGEAREALRTSLADRRESRQSLRGTVELRPSVEALDGDRAVVLDDCFANRGEYYDVDTGEVVGAFDSSFRARVEMVREAGAWKRSTFEDLGEPCA